MRLKTLQIVALFLTLPLGLAQNPAPFDLNHFLQALLGSTVDWLLNYSQGAIPALVIAWITNLVMKYVPFLAPFRDLIVQWIQAKIADYQMQRAKQVVTSTGQAYNAQVKTMATTIASGTIPPDVLDSLKQRRLAEAVNRASDIAGPVNARALVEGAVGALKAEGKNP